MGPTSPQVRPSGLRAQGRSMLGLGGDALPPGKEPRRTDSLRLAAAAGAPAHWRRRRQHRRGDGAFAGLHVAVLGTLPAPLDFDALSRLLEAGGAPPPTHVPSTVALYRLDAAVKSRLHPTNLIVVAPDAEAAAAGGGRNGGGGGGGAGGSLLRRAVERLGQLTNGAGGDGLEEVTFVRAQYLVEWVCHPWGAAAAGAGGGGRKGGGRRKAGGGGAPGGVPGEGLYVAPTAAGARGVVRELELARGRVEEEEEGGGDVSE